MTRRFWMVAGLALAGAPASAQEQCREDEKLDGARLLRRMSLDLRNRMPTVEEMRAAADGIDGETIDAFLESEGFSKIMRAHHADLLWPNLEMVEVIANQQLLVPYPTGTEPIWYAPLRSIYNRTVGNTETLYVPCLDQPAEFDEDGRIVFQPITDGGGNVVAYAEGWVEVTPYWDPSTTIRVCALDAQPDLTGTACPGPEGRYPFRESFCRGAESFDPFTAEPLRGSQVECGGSLNILSPECGCGPNLRHCVPVAPGQTVYQQITSSLVEQQMRIVERVLERDLPYEQILAETALEWNGPLVHYMRWIAGTSDQVYAGELEDWNLPEKNWSDADWTEAEASPRSAGVLTSPGFLLRFAVDRMRAHRYYNAFECRSFVPNGPLPSPFEPCSQREDLSERCGCDSCHATLEPLAAHWGRFMENGFGELPADDFPAQFGGRCQPPIDGVDTLQICLRAYNLNPPPGSETAEFADMLDAYVFRDAGEAAFIESGPGLRVESGVESGVIQSCLAERMWTELMGRAPTVEEETQVLPQIVQRFESQGRSLKAMVRAIVELPAYGEVQ